MSSNTDERKSLLEIQLAKVIKEEATARNNLKQSENLTNDEFLGIAVKIAQLFKEKKKLVELIKQEEIQGELDTLNEKIRLLNQELSNGDKEDKETQIKNELTLLDNRKQELQRLIQKHHMKKEIETLEEEIQALKLPPGPINLETLKEKQILLREKKIQLLQKYPNQDPLLQQQLLDVNQKLLEQYSRNKYLKYKNKYLQLKKLLANHN